MNDVLAYLLAALSGVAVTLTLQFTGVVGFPDSAYSNDHINQWASDQVFDYFTPRRFPKVEKLSWWGSHDLCWHFAKKDKRGVPVMIETGKFPKRIENSCALILWGAEW